MRSSPLSFLFLLFFHLQGIVVYSQVVQGIVRDGITGEPLIGANVFVDQKGGTVTDAEGRFHIQLPAGTWNMQVSYVGYVTVTREITAGTKTLNLDIRLESQTLSEVVVVADVAISRETPVAFTNVLPARLEEQLGSRDIPLVLNSTPGVYATGQGGGDGDARITIRGFNQRNVAVMIDGIPVNDMENGWVYWSNWFGLDMVTRTIQVQRGLGASKLALPSVGGTMNIITSGIETRRNLSVKQEVSMEGRIRTSLGYTSGTLPGGWSITLAGSYKRGNGWVDHTFSEGWFYYAKIDKRFHTHILSLSVLGSPQRHDQRSYTSAIATFDTAFAKDLGIDQFPVINNMGLKYNKHWGPLRRTRFDPEAKEETLSEKQNIYHKPQFSLRDFWTVNDRLTLSNIFYLSIGRGGGTRVSTGSLNTGDLDPETGQVKWQQIYDANAFSPFSIDPLYSDVLRKSSTYLQLQRNEHAWFGFLSTASYQPNNRLNISGGIDLRDYTGIHYAEVYDLLGGDYAVDYEDKRIDYIANPLAAMKYKGDKVYYYYKGYVKWGGLFAQAEYNQGIFSGFVNISTAGTGIKKKDYFLIMESAWKYLPSFTLKGGFNVDLSEHSNLFTNLGYLSKNRAFSNLFRAYSVEFEENDKNEKVKAAELGYQYNSPVFSGNINAYYTLWENRPAGTIRAKYEGEDVTGTVPGIDARHAGVEIDFIYKIMRTLDVEGLISLGDWIWNSKVDNVSLVYESTLLQATTIDFDARGIHVGDAAQTQLAGSIRYEPIKGLYLNSRYTWFNRHYAEFNPTETTDESGNPVDSWRIPGYGLLDIHAGYRFTWQKVDFSLSLSLFNALDTQYISDAFNNDSYSELPFHDFDAKSATVFFGMGRNFDVSLKISF
jgi:iron complex outermembrane receptor protein